MFTQRIRVENIVGFTSNDLTSGRVHVIPSANCKNSTANEELHLLQENADVRGYTHHQVIKIRIAVGSRSHLISVSNVTFILLDTKIIKIYIELIQSLLN